MDRLFAEAVDLFRLEKLLASEELHERGAAVREGAQAVVERLLADQPLLKGQNSEFRFFFQHVGLILGRKGEKGNFADYYPGLSISSIGQ